MNQDVKALPVVAYRWCWKLTGSPIERRFGDPDMYSWAYCEDAPIGPAAKKMDIEALVRQSDAESALAELRAEVERLTACLKKANSQAEEFERKFYLADDRADTAEARLERARGLLDLASRHVKGNARLKSAIVAFLGEGNG